MLFYLSSKHFWCCKNLGIFRRAEEVLHLSWVSFWKNIYSIHPFFWNNIFSAASRNIKGLLLNWNNIFLVFAKNYLGQFNAVLLFDPVSLHFNQEDNLMFRNVCNFPSDCLLQVSAAAFASRVYDLNLRSELQGVKNR